MSSNFFLHKLNLFKGLKNVLRDVTQTLDAVCDDPKYNALYKSVVTLYSNPALVELSKIYTNSHKFFKSLDNCEARCAPRLDSYFSEIVSLSKVSQLFVNIYRDVNAILDIIRCLDELNCVDICDTICYFDYFSKIAFPCEPCALIGVSCGPVQDACGDLLIPLNVYPVAFVMWFLYFTGRILSGCGPVCEEGTLIFTTEQLRSALEVGLIYMMEINSLIDAHDQFVKVGLALKFFPSQLK